MPSSGKTWLPDDPRGYISRVEFYAGDEKIGVSEIVFVRAPDPGTPIHHTIEWRSPPQGSHVLTARAVDSQGERIVSPPVRITVGVILELPTVGVRFVPDPRDMAWPDADFASGWFEFTRTGPANDALTVSFEVGGTATPGTDYAELSRFVVIPAGAHRLTLRVEAKDDWFVEGEETVIVSLIPGPASAAVAIQAAYRIDPATTPRVLPNRASQRRNRRDY